MKTSAVQVLIVGAGPTGLAAAAFLTRLGVKVRLIDKNEARSDKSKALGVQAGTLECLEHALGPALVESMIAAGLPAREAAIHLYDGAPISINLAAIPSRHNFILILEQSETERLFEEALAQKQVQVERRTELVSIAQSESLTQCQLRHDSGEVEEVTSEFVLGCDGAHSTVRKLLHIPFRGATYSEDFVLGDVKLEWPWAYGTVQTFVNERGAIACFPMRGEQRYRLILVPKFRPVGGETSPLQLAEFQDLVTRMSLGTIQVLESTWLTRFRVHHRMVQRFQVGRVFLAGDAAHIHSPAGGQGMNTGIQDAFNLAIKIQGVLFRGSNFASLKHYQAERRPVARRVLRGTDLVSRFVLTSNRGWLRLARRNILPRVVQSKWIQRQVVRAISEVDVARREIKRFCEAFD